MSRVARAILIGVFLGLGLIPVRMATAQPPPRYTLIDLGTLGGPDSYPISPGQTLNNRGMVIGQADTALPDPTAPFCFNPDCYLDHPFLWYKGVITDLGALPGPNNSPNNDIPVWISADGHVVGISQNGIVDPLSGAIEFRAVSFEDGKVINLGTLGGNWSVSNAVNSRGQIVGLAENALPDAYGPSLGAPCCTGFPGTQNRAVLWQDGVPHDLGTLGGNDAQAMFINEGGQVAGESFTNATPNATTGFPTEDPFLWQQGTMQDLGSLGGTVGLPSDLNDAGQVVGSMNLAGDKTHHAFVWRHGQLTDLGPLGGASSDAYWENQAGDIVGRADIPNAGPACKVGFPLSSNRCPHHAVLWKNGKMIDLGGPAGDTCATAYGVNARDQVVGSAGVCGAGGDGFLWQDGVIYNMTNLVTNLPAGWRIEDTFYINDRGEIVALADLPGGHTHDVLLVPAGSAASKALQSVSPTHAQTAPANSKPLAPGNRSPGDRTMMDSRLSRQTYRAAS